MTTEVMHWLLYLFDMKRKIIPQENKWRFWTKVVFTWLSEKKKKSIIHVTVKGLFQILFLYNFLFLQNEADAALNYIRAKSNPISKPLA